MSESQPLRDGQQLANFGVSAAKGDSTRETMHSMGWSASGQPDNEARVKKLLTTSKERPRQRRVREH